MVKIENDGKEKHQSWCAEIELHPGIDSRGYADGRIVAYGSNEEEARQNLSKMVTDVCQYLKEHS
jgi:hypothetical protein